MLSDNLKNWINQTSTGYLCKTQQRVYCKATIIEEYKASIKIEQSN